ncbi:MAG TPA: DUF4340 domain-containing protein [Methylomirabilota bacterium]|nr:DUF4340 domain-containing protein [Methylomirabilota bacterium]
MNRKQLTIVLVLGIVVGAVAFSVLRKEKASYQATDATKGDRVLPKFPLNDVTHVRIKEVTNEVNIAKVEDQWVVRERNNYPANFAEVSEFLRKVWELKPAERITVGPSQLGRLHFNPPEKGGSNTATLVEFKDGSGKNLSALTLGKKHVRESQNASPFGGGEMPVGRYVMVSDTEPKVFLVSETFSSVEAQPAQWLNKDFFKVEKVRSVAVTTETNSWKVTRESESGEFKLADAKEGEQIDTGKASGLGWVLSSPSFNDVATNIAPEVTGLDKPFLATIETFDNFTYTIKVGKPTAGEDYYFAMDVAAKIDAERKAAADEKPEDKEKLDKEHKDKIAKLEEKLKTEKALSKHVYLVAKWTVEPLQKSRQDLLQEKKPETPAPGATNAPPTLDPVPSPFPPPTPGAPAEAPKSDVK